MTIHHPADGRAVLLRLATTSDQASVLTLLRQLDLPEAGVVDWLSHFTVAATPAGDIVGIAGLEQYGSSGLLRSVAVDPAWRGTGLGHALVTAVIEQARGIGIAHLYLLTTTASGYFPRHGFVSIDRASVRAEVQASIEFRSACPASATVMHRTLS